MKKKLVLAENPHILQFVEQDFPVIKKDFGTEEYKYIDKSVKVISYLGSNANHKTYKCSHFCVEVVKDHDGFVSYILIGKGYDSRGNYNQDVWIMRTDDFNHAYDLKNRLDELVGNSVPDLVKFSCYGSLRREKRWWEREKTEISLK